MVWSKENIWKIWAAWPCICLKVQPGHQNVGLLYNQYSGSKYTSVVECVLEVVLCSYDVGRPLVKKRLTADKNLAWGGRCRAGAVWLEGRSLNNRSFLWSHGDSVRLRRHFQANAKEIVNTELKQLSGSSNWLTITAARRCRENVTFKPNCYRQCKFE